MEKSRKNIMIAFVSLVTRLNVTTYDDIVGREYKGIQTNEAAIVKAQRELAVDGMKLDKVFLVASKAVRDENNPAPEGNEFGTVTHLEFLKRRLIKEDAAFESSIEPLEYETSEQMDKALQGITKIARKIQQYRYDNSDSEIYLYADLTGGHRYSTIMLLAIMQLLQHSGFKLGGVYYTDFKVRDVFDATALERVFTLVSGADEFMNFGSVESLSDYFGSMDAEPSKALEELVTAMNSFSDAIKICHTDRIKSELSYLGRKLQAFQQEHGDSLEEGLFAELIDTIRHDYGDLLQENASDFSIIRWCVRKGFLQQAMTLCTEWLPLDFVKYDLAYTDDGLVMLECQQQGKKSGKSWQSFFINSYNPGGHEPQSTGNKDAKDILKGDFLAVLEGKKHLENTDIKASYPDIAEFLEEFVSDGHEFERLQLGFIDQAHVKQYLPMLNKALQFAYDVNCKNPNYRKSFDAFIQKETYEALLNCISTNFERFFNLKKTILPSPVKDESEDDDMESLDTKWKRRNELYEKMFKAGIMKSKYSPDTMLDCLHDYFLIRSQRNRINHANASNVMSANEMSNLIISALNKIEDILKSC